MLYQISIFILLHSSTDQIRRIEPSRKSGNPMLQAQRSVLCMEAFVECSILPDPVVILFLIHLARYKAEKQKFI